MGVAFKPLKDTANINFGKLGTMTDLLIVKQQSGFSMYAMTIVADSSYLKGNYNKVANNSYAKMDSNFTGAVLFHRMDGTFVNGWRYSNGQVTRRLSLAPAGSTVIQSTGKLQVDVDQPCTTIEVTTYWEDCSYSQGTNYTVAYDCYDYTTTDDYQDCPGTGEGTGGGTTGSAPPPCQVPAPGGSPSDASVKGKLQVDVAAPPTGGSGGTSPTDPPLEPCPTETVVTPVSVTTDTVKDPCANLTAVNTLAQNANNVNTDHLIYNTLATGHEYGAPQNLTSWPNGSYMPVTNLNTNYDESNLTANFTWVPNGYTINIAHSHPGGGAPSPADVFKLFVNSNNNDLDNAGSAAVSFYKTNASITVISSDASYVVMGADYTQLASLYAQYKASLQPDGKTYGFNQTYEALANDNNGSTEYALLTMFGSSIYLYKANANTSTFTVISLDKNGNVVVTNCPSI
jgi:hypothetical protein